jgi:hypothetical protein
LSDFSSWAAQLQNYRSAKGPSRGTFPSPYFLGANDPYQSLKTTLKAEIDQEAWESLHSAVSRPFPKPTTGRIAVKVINHLGDEVMKVFPVVASGKDGRG